MSRFLGRMMIWLLLAAAAIFMGFQVWRLMYDNIKTQPAESYVMDEKLSITGIAVREEFILPEGGENLSYLYPDGEHVSRHSVVAREVGDKNVITERMQRDSLQKELDSLYSVSAGSEQVLIGADAMSGRVYSDLDALMSLSSRGDLSGGEEIKLSIISQLNRREIATGKTEGFGERITMLEGKLATLGTSSFDIGEDDGIKTPEPGYFTKTVDSLETTLTPESIKTMTSSVLEGIIAAPPAGDEKSVGRIITSHIWYFSAVVPSDMAVKFIEGKKVEVDFGLTGQKPLIAKVEEIRSEPESGKSIVTLQCDEMSEVLSGMRVHKADVSFAEVSGFRFPRESKRYERDQLGVYVLDGAIVRFKPAELIYEDEEYAVFSESFGGNNSIKPFDNVVVKGRGLYDGKIIRQQ